MMNLQKVEFVKSAAQPNGFPADTLPQIAFAGKSNVGKSSVLNCVLQRKNFARVGQTPGKTVHINFFRVDDKAYFVDLPGYGYTRIAESVKADWGKMVERYLKKSSMLIKVFLLVDMRHKPTEDDRLMYDWIVSQGFAPVIIATKSDKLKKNEKPKALKLIRDTFGLPADGVIIPFSAIDKNGLNDIYAVINSEKSETEHKE